MEFWNLKKKKLTFCSDFEIKHLRWYLIQVFLYWDLEILLLIFWLIANFLFSSEKVQKYFALLQILNFGDESTWNIYKATAAVMWVHRHINIMVIMNLIGSGTSILNLWTLNRHLGELKFKQKGREEQCEPDNPIQPKRSLSGSQWWWLGSLSGKKYGIIWEFFPYGGEIQKKGYFFLRPSVWWRQIYHCWPYSSWP